MQYNGESTFPQAGWPQGLTPYIHSSVQLLNFAVNGRSTKTFFECGDYEKALAKADENSIVLIEFGHNDEHKAQPERFTTPDEYKDNLRRMVCECRNKGAFVVLLTPVARRNFTKDGRIDITCHKEYTDAMLELAKSLNVDCIDMTRLTAGLFEKFGPEGSKMLFMQFGKDIYPNYPDGMSDNTHLRQKGADAISELFAGQAKKIKKFEGYLL